MTILIEGIGIFGSCCIALCLFPQTFKIIKTKSMTDISISFILLTMIGGGSQMIYGVYYHVTPMIIANSCVLANTGSLLVYKYYLQTYTDKSLHLNVPLDASLKVDIKVESS